MQYVFTSVVTIVKSYERNVKIIFVWLRLNNMVKCRRNMDFEEMDTEPSTGKKWWVFWLPEGIFKEYIKQNIIMAMLRRANAHLQIDKKTNNVKEDPSRKTDLNFGFSQAVWGLWGFNKKECYVVRISFYTRRGWNGS